VALAGCSSSGDGDDPSRTSTATDGAPPPTTRPGTETSPADETTSDVGPQPPLEESQRHLGLSRQVLLDNVISGGPGKDGIPSIDDPQFVDVPTADETLGDASRIIGIVRDGEARAYPRQILVYHEIVNDEIGGHPVNITYCPLTGTALGFERGETTFGVSGRLVNNNLVMYDRGTDSWWPQIAGTAIRGHLHGATLREVPLHWTRWDLWKQAFPDSTVLSEETGYIRAYGEDPYGYDYYSSGPPLFPPVLSSDRFDDKTVVLGARGRDSALAVLKSHLERERLIELTLDGEAAVGLYDGSLDTGYVYRNPSGRTVEDTGDGYAVDGERYRPAELPLERVHAFEAMWFAWYGFYPESTVYA
jgi:hypothetical protein